MIIIKIIKNKIYYTFIKDDEYIKVSGVGDDPENLKNIKWESSKGAKGILSQLDDIKSGYSPKIGFVTFSDFPNNIYIQIAKFEYIYKDGWRFDNCNLPAKIIKMQRRVHVKASKRAKAYHRMQEVGREEIDPKNINNLWEIPIDKFSRLISGDKLLLKEKYIREKTYNINDSHPKLEYLISIMNNRMQELHYPKLNNFIDNSFSVHEKAIVQALEEHIPVPLYVMKDYPDLAHSYEIDISENALKNTPTEPEHISDLYEMSKDRYDKIIKSVKQDYNKDPKKITDSMLNREYSQELEDTKRSSKLRKKIYNNLPEIFKHRYTPETMNRYLHSDLVQYMAKEGKIIPDEVKNEYPMYFKDVPINLKITEDKNIDKEINNILKIIRYRMGDVYEGSKLQNIILKDIIKSNNDKIPINISNGDYNIETLIELSIAHLSNNISPKLLNKIKEFDKNIKIKYDKNKNRSNFNDGTINLSNKTIISNNINNTVYHEYGHAIEYMVPEIKELCNKFLNTRTKNEDEVSLNSISSFYNKYEMTKIDNFVDPYIGKLYDSGDTEILSMGMGYMANSHSLTNLYMHDPAYLGFIVSILSGKIGLNENTKLKKILLIKSERGTHTGIVRVKRDGKIFNRKQRVGKKVIDKSINLNKLNDDELKQQIQLIHDEYPEIDKSIKKWYDYGGGTKFNEEMTSVFKMNPEKSGSKNIIDVDKNTAKGYKKLYSVTQEYLKRKHPHGITVFRGLGSKTYQKYKDGSPGDSIDVEQHNVSSWSTDYEMAKDFADSREDGGIIIEFLIPNKRIFIHPDCASKYSSYYDESEVIIMGNKIDATISELIISNNKNDDDEYDYHDDDDDESWRDD